ncbi:DUF6879 family protein [Nocardia sp. NPDC003963]
MRLLRGEAFDEFFHKFERTAYHLEVLDTYETPEESEPFQNFLDGRPRRLPVVSRTAKEDVRAETVPTELTIGQFAVVALYNRAFRSLRNQDVHGRDARAMITGAMN